MITKSEAFLWMYEKKRLSPKHQLLVEELKRRGKFEDYLNKLDSEESVEKIIPEPEQKQRGTFEELGRQTALTARYLAEGIAGAADIAYQPLAYGTGKLMPESFQPAQSLEKEISGILTKIGVPEPENEAERIIAQASRLVAGAAGTAGLAKGIASKAGGITKAVASEMAAQPAQQIAGAAGSGIAEQKLKEMEAPLPVQIAGSLIGGMTSAKASGLKYDKVREGAEATKEALKRGIRVGTSDIAKPTGVFGRTAQWLSERTVLGPGTFLRGPQQKERVAAVADTLDQFNANQLIDINEEIAMDLINKKGRDLARDSEIKGKIIRDFDFYGRVDADKTVNTIDDAIKELKALNNDDLKNAISILKNYKTAFSKNKNISSLNTNRRLLGDRFKQEDLGHVNGVTQPYINKIYDSVRSDIYNHVRTIDKRAAIRFKAANDRLYNAIQDLNDKALVKILEKGRYSKIRPDGTVDYNLKPEELKAAAEGVEKILLGKKESSMMALLNNLTPHGKANVKAQFLKHAAKKATKENLDPDKFVDELNNISKNYGLAFTGRDRQVVDGLVEALKLTSRAETVAKARETGQVIPYAISGVAGQVLSYFGFGSAVGGIVTSAALGQAANIFESRLIRSTLMKIPKVSSKEEKQKLVKRFYTLMQSKYEEEIGKERGYKSRMKKRNPENY